MKRIGLIGGVSPESTVIYYRLLNAAARQAYGGDSSADMVIQSLNFGYMHELYRAADWTTFKKTVVGAAKNLENAGCDLIAISSNTTQMSVFDVVDTVNVPVINLLDAVSAKVASVGSTNPLLLGTRMTMEGEFYRPTMAERYGLTTITPDTDDRIEVNRIIFDELCEGEILGPSRKRYVEVIERGREQGADGVILGCTEIGMLISQEHVDIPVFDTTKIHAAAIAEFAFAPTSVQ